MEYLTLLGLVNLILLVSAPWVLLSLLGTLGDVGVGYIDEWLLRKVNPEKRKEIDAPGRLVLISGFFGIIVSTVVFVIISILGNSSEISIYTGYLALFAGMLEVLWLIPYFYALEKGGALNTTPLFQTIPIFALIFGILIFNEVPTGLHILASLLIIVGVFILNYSKTKGWNLYTIGLMLSASILISLGYFFFKDSTTYVGFAISLFWNGIGMLFLSSLIWLFWAPYRNDFNSFIRTCNVKIFLIQFCNESLYALSAIAGLAAIVLGPSVMAVSTLAAFHPIFTLIIGYLLAKFGSKTYQQHFSDQSIYIKTTAIILIAVGTVLIIL